MYNLPKKNNLERIITALPIVLLVVLLLSTAGLGSSIKSNLLNSIQADTSILTREQVGDVFKNSLAPTGGVSYSEFNEGSYYLLLQIKNENNVAVWGTIDCYIDDRPVSTINLTILGPNMTDFTYFVVPLTGVYLAPENKIGPEVEIVWKTLKSK